MLPGEDAIAVGEELSRRFGLARWLFTLTATDANRTALRLARQITGRPYVLVFSYCYHGSVDEAFAVAGDDGGTHSREGNVGPAVDPAQTTRAVEFNDLGALEAALADGLRGVRAGRAGDDEHGHRRCRSPATTSACASSRARAGRC